MLLPKVNRNRLSFVRYDHRLGAFGARRTPSRGACPLRRNVAGGGRRHWVALAAADGSMGEVAAGATSAETNVDGCLGVVGSRRARLVPPHLLAAVKHTLLQ